MIDSMTNSACLCYYVQNSLSYSGEETRLTLCKLTPSSQLSLSSLERISLSSLERNKHQLLHRIQSVRTFTNLQYPELGLTKIAPDPVFLAI